MKNYPTWRELNMLLEKVSEHILSMIVRQNQWFIYDFRPMGPGIRRFPYINGHPGIRSNKNFASLRKIMSKRCRMRR